MSQKIKPYFYLLPNFLYLLSNNYIIKWYNYITNIQPIGIKVKVLKSNSYVYIDYTDKTIETYKN